MARRGSRSNTRQITIEFLGDDRQARRAWEATRKASEQWSRDMQKASRDAASGAERFGREFSAGLDMGKRSMDDFARSLGENVRGDLESLVTWGKRAVLAVAGVATAIGAIAIKGGVDRALNIEDAQAKLSALGHDTEAVEQVMESALNAVRGTSFGLDAAVGAAAQAMAAGTEAGEELERVLRLTGDAAAFMGNDFERAGQIVNKVLASDRLTMREVNQLHIANIGILQMLAEAYQVSALEMRKMVEQGVVDSKIFLDALESNIGGAALELGDTTRGMFANMRAAMSRFGEVLAVEVMPLARELFGSVTEGFDQLTTRIRPFVAEFGSSDLFRGLVDHIQRIPEYFDRAVDAAVAFWEATEGLRDAFGSMLAGAGNIISFLIDLNGWLGGLPAIIGAVGAALWLLVAHPVIGTLGLIALAVGEMTRGAREAEAAIGDLQRAIEEAERTGDQEPLFEKVGDQLAEVAGSVEFLMELLRELAITPDQAVGFVLGDPDDVDAVTRALASYRTEAERAFHAGEIGTHEFARRVGLTGSVLSTTEEALETVAARYIEGEEARNAFVEAHRSLAMAESADRVLLGHVATTEKQTEAWYRSAEAAEAYQERITTLDDAIAALAATWGEELNREFQDFINIFEQAPEIDLTQIVKTDDEGNQQVVAEGVDALIQNAENRIDQAERWLAGIQRLVDLELPNLAEEFRGRGIEGLGDLEAVLADVDAGAARAFELDETLAKARQHGTSVTGELGTAMAAEALTLYAQAEEIGEGTVEALARGASGARVSIDMDLVTRARMVSSGGRRSPGTPGASDAGIQFRQRGGRYAPGPLVVGEDGPELQFPDRPGFVANNQMMQRLLSLGANTTTTSHHTTHITIPSSGDPRVDAQRAGYMASVVRRVEGL